MACLFTAILLGCSVDSRIVQEKWWLPTPSAPAGYQKVCIYYNGGENRNFTYIEYFVKNSLNEKGETVYYRLPIPSSLSSPVIEIPNKTGYRFYGWYQVNFDAFDTREEEIWTEYITADGEKKREPVLNVNKEPAVQEVPYLVKGDEIYDPNRMLTLRDYENETESGYSGEKLFIGPWNFDFDKVDKDICLIALWEPERYYVIVPPENKSDLFDDENYRKQKGALEFGNILANGALQRPTIGRVIPEKAGFQMEDFYLDRACTVRVPFDSKGNYYPRAEMIKSADGTEKFKVFPIYTKWIDKNFKKISRASELSNISQTGKYYIMDDLDFVNRTLSVADVFRGEIRGNKHVWSNLNITINENRPSVGMNTYGGIFKELSGAKIRDITFKNLNITFVRLNPTAVAPSAWNNPVLFNVFAKKIESSIVQNINVGADSSFSIISYVVFQFLMGPVIDENGHPYRVGRVEGTERTYDVKADANGDYPEEGSIYGGFVLKYDKDDYGKYVLKRVSLTDPEDGRRLYGNEIIDPPSSAPEIGIGQTEDNFGFGVDSDVLDCSNSIVQKKMPLLWRVTYSPGDDSLRPLPASDYADKATADGMEWAGWYEFDEITHGYKRFDFTFGTDKPVVLTAMWKLRA